MIAFDLFFPERESPRADAQFARAISATKKVVLGTVFIDSDAEIRYLDDRFGRLEARLREAGIWEGAAVVFLSDHGEGMGEHDYFFEHGWFADEAGLRVPLFVKEPGQTAGRRMERQVTNLDVLPMNDVRETRAFYEKLGFVCAHEHPPPDSFLFMIRGGAILQFFIAPGIDGTIRDHTTLKRRAFVRFFACGQDLSHEAIDTPLPNAVATGSEPFMVIGAIAGG